MSIIIMFLGVAACSLALGSLTSLLTTMDSKQAKLKEKLEVLEEMRAEYLINYKTYIKLRKAVKYDHSRNEKDKFEFLKELPQSLNIELSVIMHQEMINKIPFFQNKDPSFIAFCGPMLRPMKIQKDEFIFKEGEPIDESKNIISLKFFCSVFSCKRLCSICN
jgi:hypothetical protein